MPEAGQGDDTGANTNPERWLHDNHWDCNEVTIAVAGVPGQQNLGAVVGVGVTRRITKITARNAGTNPTIITLLIAGGATRWTYVVPEGVSRTIPVDIEFAAGEQPAIQTSDVTGGSTYVSASGVEA